MPKRQPVMLKRVIDQAIDAMGLEQARMFATGFDGIARHPPEGLRFWRSAEESGFPAAVERRASRRSLPAP